MTTMDATPHPPPSPARVWIAMLAAPAAWAAQGLLGWLVASLGCVPGDAGWLSPPTAHALELGISAAALAVAGAALAIGWAAWRGGARAAADVQGRARPDFLAATAMLVSAVFVIAVALAAMPQFVLPMCETAR